MIIDLTKLITSSLPKLKINGEVVFENTIYENTSIRELRNVNFDGEISKLCDDTYQIEGTLKGVMILPDDITLEDVSYPFETQVEEKFKEFGNFSENNLEIVRNRLDITEFLWQNILVEIPLKVKLDKNEDLTLKGDGWRLVTEDELNRGNNSPFSELSDLFDSRKE